MVFEAVDVQGAMNNKEMGSTQNRLEAEVSIFKPKENFGRNRNLLIFFPLLVLIDILVFETIVGVLILLGIALLFVSLLKPKFLYFALVSLLSIEGFQAVSSVSYPKIAAVLLMMGLTIRLTLTKGSIPVDDNYKYFFLFFVGSLVSFAFATNFVKSLTTYLTYISLFIFYVFTRYFLRKERDIHTALNCLFISTLIAFAIVQTLGLSVRSVSSRISSGIGDPNGYAAFILVLIPLVLYRIMHSFGIARILYWGCLISFLMLLVMTGSRGGMLGFIGASGILIYHYSIGKLRQLFLFFLTAAVIAYFIAPDFFWERAQTITNPGAEKGHSISVRIDNYKAALKIFADYPIAGVGLTNFKFIGGDYGAKGGGVVHNTYLEILTGGGLLSFIPFGLILVSLWRKLKLRKKYNKKTRDLLICLRASFVAILITSFFLTADNNKILWFLFALISSTYYEASKQKVLSNVENS
jgi:O-antigen ligase